MEKLVFAVTNELIGYIFPIILPSILFPILFSVFSVGHFTNNLHTMRRGVVNVCEMAYREKILFLPFIGNSQLETDFTRYKCS